MGCSCQTLREEAAFAKSWRRRAAIGEAARRHVASRDRKGPRGRRFLILLAAAASTFIGDLGLVVLLAVRPLDPQHCLMRDQSLAASPRESLLERTMHAEALYRWRDIRICGC
jgi:hypothetical protein